MARGRGKKNQAPHCADTRAVNGIKGFAGIPKCVVESDAYRRLSLIARAILVEIVARMDGHNNGQIHVSYAELAKCLNRKNQAPIGPAIAELIEHGLIALSAESIWQERRAREYRLTFANTSDSIGRTIPATNDYLGWQAKIDTTDAVAEEAQSATTVVASPTSVATDAVAAPNGKLPKAKSASATTGVVPIIKPYAAAQSEAADPSNPTPQNAGGPIAAGKAA